LYLEADGVSYKIYEFVDIRIYFLDDASEWQPTKKGVAVALDLWPEFAAAINKVEVEDAPAQWLARPLQRHKHIAV
jgi:hypothetical protein